jgi:hypothetical protein
MVFHTYKLVTSMEFYLVLFKITGKKVNLAQYVEFVLSKLENIHYFKYF